VIGVEEAERDLQTPVHVTAILPRLVPARIAQASA
jgi:hypothetical protein